MPETLKLIAYRYRLLVGVVVPFLIISLISALFSEVKTIVDYVAFPLTTLFTTLHPSDETPDFLKVLYAGLCLYFYLAIASFPVYYIHTKRLEDSTTETLDIELYSKELADTLSTLENPSFNEEVLEEVLEVFLRNISNKIIESFPNIKVSTLRYAFLLSERDASNMEYSSVKFDKNGSLTVDDHKIIEWILTNTEEDFYINGNIKNDISEVTTGYDMDAVGLVRNSGEDFRFGFVIFFPNSEVLLDSKAVDQFIRNSSVIRVFAYMDTLWKFMLQYSYRVTGGG
ncbi:hypothetical protein [Exiguobacterium acetylicum]|uniref:hypothetical protein n=1 Tax=Exiguobacterium acetylicum TaxID=41170 RepID=UPI0034D5ABCF